MYVYFARVKPFFLLRFLHRDFLHDQAFAFGNDSDLHGDSNSSYDPAHAIPVGRMLEEYRRFQLFRGSRR
jgi:hypothetical protein